MRIPFTSRVHGSVGGGLIFNAPLKVPVLRAPLDFDAPPELDNAQYLTPLENQGHNPWCLAYAMCQALQASYWRRHNRKLDFAEALAYETSKGCDGVKGPGTTMEAIITVARTTDLSGGKAPMPIVKETLYLESSDIVFAVHRHGLVLTGLNITEGWKYTKMNGMVGDSDRRLGGHGVLTCGYNIDEGWVKGPNWWGSKWGRDGFWQMTRDQFASQFLGAYGLDITWPEVTG